MGTYHVSHLNDVIVECWWERINVAGGTQRHLEGWEETSAGVKTGQRQSRKYKQ